VRKIDSTGVAAVGRKIARVCGQNLKLLPCGLGGKNSAFVLSDASIELAAREFIAGAFAKIVIHSISKTLFRSKSQNSVNDTANGISFAPPSQCQNSIPFNQWLMFSYPLLYYRFYLPLSPQIPPLIPTRIYPSPNCCLNCLQTSTEPSVSSALSSSADNLTPSPALVGAESFCPNVIGPSQNPSSGKKRLSARWLA
jgi:hypothetical protein